MKNLFLLFIVSFPALCFAQLHYSNQFYLLNETATQNKRILQTNVIHLYPSLEKKSNSTTFSLSHNNSLILPLDTPGKKKPQILLLSKESLGIVNVMGPMGSERKMGYVKGVGGFEVDTITYESRHWARDLKPFIRTDPKAYRIYRKSRIYNAITIPAASLCLISLIPVAYYASVDSQYGTADTDGMTAFAAISLINLSIFLIAELSAEHSIYKCVKVYNKNAGYGYVNGWN